jgi:thioredoxin 1
MMFYASVLTGFFLLAGWSKAMADQGSVTTVSTVTQADFKTEVLQSKLPVLVDFYATWCVPCRLYSQVVDQAAKDYAGRLKVVRVDVDKNPKLVSAYGVEELPTTQLIKNGKKFKKRIGDLDKEDVETEIDKMLKSAK